jgi:sarcosine oxidase subunit gamma
VHDLIAITALGASEPQVETIGGITCTEVANLALASVAARLGGEAACRERLASLVGTVPAAGKAELTGPFSAKWVGPDQWMVGVEYEVQNDIAAHVKAALGNTASVTEQTDAWSAFDLSGQRINRVLELLCNINLSSVGAGSATRTSIHHLSCFVICRVPNANVRILGPRASATSLHSAITTAMRSVR